MACSNQSTPIFGIHQITAYNTSTGLPYGSAQVIGSAELSSSGELIELNGGSSKYPFRVERGLITVEVTLTLKEYPPFLFNLLLGKEPTINAPEASGFVSTITNQNGDSVVDAVNGINSVSISTATDVKYSDYIIEVVTADTVNVYAYTNVDFSQGTDAQYIDGTLKINATPLTVTSGGATVIPDFGIQINGGSGTIGMTIGDTAKFSARSTNSGSTEVTIGSCSEVFTDFGLILVAQRASEGDMQILDIYKAVASGMPIAMTENAFSELQTTIKCFRDPIRDGVYSFRTEKAIS